MRALARMVTLVLVSGTAACSGADPADPAAPSAEPRLAWSKPWGSPGDDFARGVAVRGDAIFVTGYTDGAFDGATNIGSFDAFVTRQDRDGSAIWSTQWGGDGPEFAQAVVSGSAGDLLVAGYSPSRIDGNAVAGGHDVFITKLTEQGVYGGTEQWGTDADDFVYAAAPLDGGIVVAGYTKSAFDGFESAGGADAFVARCDDSGAPVWIRQLGTAATDYAQAVHVDASGRILVAGYTAGKLGDDDDAGAEDAFAFALDAEGELLWLRQWGSDTTDYALSVTSDAAGNAYVAGYTYGAMPGQAVIGGEDGYVSKLGVEGELRWTRQFGTVSRDSARFVTLLGDEVLVGGDTEGALAEGLPGGGRDAFLARFDADGNESFRAQWGGSPEEFSLAGDALDGSLYVAGYVEPQGASRDALLTRWSF